MAMPMQDVEVLRAACCVAGIDRNVCEREHPLLKRLAAAAGVGMTSLNAMIERAKTDSGFFEKQFDIFKSDSEATMKTLFRVAVADGVLTQSERVVLQHFAAKLGMTTERYAELLAAAEKHAKGE